MPPLTARRVMDKEQATWPTDEPPLTREAGLCRSRRLPPDQTGRAGHSDAAGQRDVVQMPPFRNSGSRHVRGCVILCAVPVLSSGG